MAKRILIIDDNHLNREILKNLLGQAGFETAGVGDGKAGLDKMMLEKFDLVLLDIILPGLDGFGVLSILKSDPATKDIPVMFLSGRDNPEEREEAIRMGAVDCLVKHRCPPMEIVKAVKRVLG
jgi:CheY-like chemotaxis protein